MIRRAFTMRLKPGAMTEYRRHHDNIPTEWPELVKEIERSGIASITTFERDPDLFLFSEIHDPQAWDKLWNSEIHRKWGEIMEPLMNFKNGIVDFGELREIFRHETKAGKKKAARKPVKKAVKKTAKKSKGKKHGKR